jgi:hypothetical protein
MSDAEAPDRPFVAGMYDYYLGGTANTAADRAAVERIREVLPEIEQGAWSNRGFLQRAVTAMAVDPRGRRGLRRQPTGAVRR